MKDLKKHQRGKSLVSFEIELRRKVMFVKAEKDEKCFVLRSQIKHFVIIVVKVFGEMYNFVNKKEKVTQLFESM